MAQQVVHSDAVECEPQGWREKDVLGPAVNDSDRRDRWVAVSL